MFRYINTTDYFRDKPLNFLFKFNNNLYPLLDDYSNINILVDSGAFYHNFTDKTKNDEQTFNFINKYMDFIINTLDDSRIVGYFEMDLLYLGLNRIKKIRRKLFKLTNKIIPVYQIEYGEHEFKQMCRKYNYIGFPCPSTYSSENFMPFVKYAHKHGCRIHGLSMDRDNVMRDVPFNSTDSALWIRRAIYAGYYYNHNIPKTTENNFKYQSHYLIKELMTQMQRQEFFRKHWSNYHRHQKYGKIGENN